MAPTARVWMTYNDKATKIVVEALEDWREGLDMLLVFVSSAIAFRIPPKRLPRPPYSLL